jgi:hypothetical protein
MDPGPATLRTTPASVAAVESAGIKKLKIYHMVNIKQNSPRKYQDLRSRASGESKRKNDSYI